MRDESLPLVSCICITHNAVDLLKRSIACFQHQTYSNTEIIIAYTSDNAGTKAFLDQLCDTRIVGLEFPEQSLTLGQKRNLAIEKSHGFYFCVWDDDDWYSNTRIEFQVQRLKDTSFKCSVLDQLLIYDGKENEAYLSGKRWAWEQTLLCEKSVTQDPLLRYADLNYGEDSELVFQLREKDLLLTIHNPTLYVYIYHGHNTWHRKHWEENILQWGTKLPPGQTILVKAVLDGEYLNDEGPRLMSGLLLPKN